ncbi:MAG: diheme cytochrome c-553 [Flavitalea sp.]
MRQKLILSSICLSIFIISCNDEGEISAVSSDKLSANVVSALKPEDLVTRGEYLITVGGCNDCHSPKIFMNGMMLIDSSKLLSGHQLNSPLPKVNKSSLQPGQWMSMSPDATAFAGPWGISYAVNLTSDSATGIGAWTEDAFIKTLRTGKHLGHDNGRPILPPMPWYNLSKLKEDDLKAMYAYLQTVSPINNRVPAPVPPTEVKTQ